MAALPTIAAALAGALVFDRLHVPAGALIGAFIAVAALNLIGSDTYPLPKEAEFLALAALGWLIGQSVDGDTIATLRTSLVPIVIAVVAMLAFGALLAMILTHLGLMDSTTAFLATSPGALSQMSAMATSLEANAALVATTHLIRLISVILISPLVARLIESR